MIQLTNLSKSFGGQTLFNDVNFKMQSQQKIGFVGRNGSGKSTLFKMILGEEPYDSGSISIPKNYRIGTLKQHLVFTEPTVREECALVLSEDEQWNFYKIEKLLFGLGFSEADLDKDPWSFSGGFQIRINLVKLLATEPNMLLLDEPTNYLDILSLRWLKGFIKEFDGEVILITHDRDFMDSVTTHTMGVQRKSLHIVSGDSHKYYGTLELADETYEKTKANQDKKRKDLEEFVARNKARASTAALAQSKQKELDKMDDMEDLKSDATLSFNFNYKDTPAKVIFRAEELGFGYNPEEPLFQNITFAMEKGKRLAIIGKNGKGKSTLLNTIAKELKQLSGVVGYHGTTTFAHFGQTNISHLSPNNTVMDEIYVGNAGLSEAQVRSICGGMMFSGDNAKKKISLLSGGEKSRVMLGQILARHVNLLLLDEPTNHLDIDSIEALTNAIKKFKGSVIIVTHSEELLRRVCDRLIIFAKDGAEYFDGGYDDFLEKIGWEDEEQEVKVKAAPKSNNKENKKLKAQLVRERNKITSPLKKKVEKFENKIMKLEELLETHHQELIEVSNSGDSSALMELSKLVSKEEAEVEALFEQFEVSQMELDEINESYESKIEELS